MCTLIVLHRVHPVFPVVIAGNRDEVYVREAAPPQVLSDEPHIVGGLDRERGGTWLGLTPGGVCAAITNQRSWTPPPPAARSRGEVVLRVLQATSRAAPEDRPRAIREHLEAMDPGAQNSFNLLVADPDTVLVAYARRDERTIDVENLAPGIHVLANDRMGSPAFPKQHRARSLIEPHARAPWSELSRQLPRALADHETPPPERLQEPPPGAPFSREVAAKLQAICIHTPNYGTRSATVAALHPDGVAHYLYADGPPCEARFEDQAQLLGPPPTAQAW